MSRCEKDYCSCSKPVEVTKCHNVNVANCPDVNVVNSPDVKVVNCPDVKVVNNPDVNVVNTVRVGGCVQTDKKLVPFTPLSAKSIDCTQATPVPIPEHPCVQHCYDFECDWNDSCGNQNGAPGAGVSWSDSNPVGSPPVLGKYMVSDGSESLKLGLGNINFNALGFAISFWFRANELGAEVDDRFIAKSFNNHVQDHIVSAQLSGSANNIGILKFRLKLGHDISSGTTQWITGEIVQPDTWHHAVFWYDGCEVRIYLDGEQAVLTEYGIGGGNNGAAAFSSVKGRPVFQGDQAVAVASQPQIGDDHPGWRAFDGCLDQLVIWSAAINENLIDALYADGQGADAVPVTVGANCASFSNPQIGHIDLLACFSQMICVQSCFHVDLCRILEECGNISLEVVDGSDNVVHTLVDNCAVGQWPGGFDILETKKAVTEDDDIINWIPEWGDCITAYTIRLTLDIAKNFGCAVSTEGVRLRFSVHQNGNNVRLPLAPFSMTGQRRSGQD
jgi:Concanavalin A-like lectin/glucanases superfamily